MNFILTGLAGSGKSTVAKYLEEHHNIKEFALADKLKQLVFRLCKTFDVPINSVEDLYNVATKNNYRKYMQQVGTECCRAVFGNNFWCEQLKQSIQAYGKDVVISDIRFLNEYAYFKDHSVCIKITGRQFDDPNMHKHASELEIMNIPCDYEIVNDGTLEELYAKVEGVLKTIKSINDNILIIDVKKNESDIDMLTKHVNNVVKPPSSPKNEPDLFTKHVNNVASNLSLPSLAKTSSSLQKLKQSSTSDLLHESDANSSRKSFTITRESTTSVDNIAVAQSSPVQVPTVQVPTVQVPTVQVPTVQQPSMQTQISTVQQPIVEQNLFDLTVFEKQPHKESKSSYQLGIEGEADIAQLIAQVAPKFEIVNTSKIAHSGDLHVFDTKHKIEYLVECKNKQTIDRKGDIDKFISDVEGERTKQTTSDGYTVVGIFFAIRNDKIPTIGEYAFTNNMIYLSKQFINKEVLRIIFSMFKFYITLQPISKHNDGHELSPETRKMLNCLKSECQKFEEEKNTYNKMLKNANAIVSDIQGLNKNITIKETIIRMIDFPNLIDSHADDHNGSKITHEDMDDISIPSLIEQKADASEAPTIEPPASKKKVVAPKKRTSVVMFSEAYKGDYLDSPIRAQRTADYTPKQWVEIIGIVDNIRIDTDAKKRTELMNLVNMNVYRALGKFGTITFDIWKGHSEEELMKFRRKITKIVKNATTVVWPFTIKELKVEFPEFARELRRMTREDLIRNYSIKEDL